MSRNAHVAPQNTKPTGHITVNGEPMAYWLPAGVTAKDIGVEK